MKIAAGCAASAGLWTLVIMWPVILIYAAGAVAVTVLAVTLVQGLRESV